MISYQHKVGDALRCGSKRGLGCSHWFPLNVYDGDDPNCCPTNWSCCCLVYYCCSGAHRRTSQRFRILAVGTYNKENKDNKRGKPISFRLWKNP